MRQGHSGAVMCAKNQVNNAFSWQSQPQLVDTLRGRWSFPGVVMSDRPQTVTPIDAVKDGAVSRDIAQQAAVLLKNDNAGLPPDARALHSIAVVGPFAGAAMSGGGGGSSHVLALDTVSPVDGIRNRVGPDVTVTYAPGADAASIPAAVDAAKAADVAVVMVGDNEAEGRDRPSMTLSAPRTTWSRRWPRPTRGTKAAQGATVAYLAAALLALLSIAGFVHALVTPRTRAFAVPEAVSAAA